MLENKCMYVEWYKFNRCDIRTCKNYSDVTPTRCLGIDRVQPSGTKIISDAELHMYKFSSDKVSTRLVSLKRKKAMNRIKVILVLNEYLNFIRTTHKPENRVYQNEYTTRLEKQFPLKVKRLKFESWMWPHLVDVNNFKKFSLGLDGESKEIELHELLGTTLMKFKMLQTSLKV